MIVYWYSFLWIVLNFIIIYICVCIFFVFLWVDIMYVSLLFIVCNRKYEEVEGEFFWFIYLLGFIRVSELFMGVVLYGECLFVL